MPVSSPPYKDVPVAGQVQVLSPRSLSLSVPQTSSYSLYCAPELMTAHAHSSIADEHREPIQQDSSVQCRRPVSTSPASVRSDSSSHFFNTHSPPLLNLSPNLSPSMSDVQLMSPCYDLRESTRRQSSLYGEEHLFCIFCLKCVMLALSVCAQEQTKKYCGCSLCSD